MHDIVDLVIEEGAKVATGETQVNTWSDSMKRGDYRYSCSSSVALANVWKIAWMLSLLKVWRTYCKLTTMTLVRQVAAVSIPVIAAGGTLQTAREPGSWILRFGAEAVQVKTRFVVAKESNAHPKL